MNAVKVREYVSIVFNEPSRMFLVMAGGRVLFQTESRDRAMVYLKTAREERA